MKITKKVFSIRLNKEVYKYLKDNKIKPEDVEKNILEYFISKEYYEDKKQELNKEIEEINKKIEKIDKKAKKVIKKIDKDTLGLLKEKERLGLSVLSNIITHKTGMVIKPNVIKEVIRRANKNKRNKG